MRMMDTRTEGTMKEEQKLGKKRHNRGRNNEFQNEIVNNYLGTPETIEEVGG